MARPQTLAKLANGHRQQHRWRHGPRLVVIAVMALREAECFECPTNSLPMFGLSSEVCERVALSQGKTAGGCNRIQGNCGGVQCAFKEDFNTKGCYGFTSGSHTGCFYYGTISGQDITSESQLNSVSSPQHRPVQATGSDAASDCICNIGYTSDGNGACVSSSSTLTTTPAPLSTTPAPRMPTISTNTSVNTSSTNRTSPETPSKHSNKSAVCLLCVFKQRLQFLNRTLLGGS